MNAVLEKGQPEGEFAHERIHGPDRQSPVGFVIDADRCPALRASHCVVSIDRFAGVTTSRRRCGRFTGSGAPGDFRPMFGSLVRSASLDEIVIVDPVCERYGDFVGAAQAGEIGLHFCIDGQSAVRLSRRFRADAWLIAAELPDMSGFDLVEMLSPRVLQGDVDPLLGGARISLASVGHGMRSGIFIVADAYRLEEEQQALVSGVAGYLVRPVRLDVIRSSRSPALPSKGTATAMPQ